MRARPRTLTLLCLVPLAALGVGCAADDATTSGTVAPGSVAPGSTSGSTPTTGATTSSSATSATSSPTSASSTSETTAAGVDLASSCTWAAGGVVIAYPSGWFTPADGELGACQVFDPAPVTIEPDADGPMGAVTALHHDAYDAAVAEITDPTYESVETETPQSFGGGPGACWTTVSTGAGLFPAGWHTQTCLVDFGDSAAGFSTTWAPEAADPQLGDVLVAMTGAVAPA